MSFGRLKTTPAPATPAPAAAATPPPAPLPTPSPAPTPAAVVTVPKPAPAGGLILAAPKAAGVLAVVAQSGEQGSVGSLFPTLVIKGGNAGGTLSPSGSTDKEVGKLLPQGRQPIEAVYMAFRVEAIAWPTDFDAKKEGDRPSISAAISCDDIENTQMLLKACENFQFCPKDAKGKWDVANGGPGHLRPEFQMLVYLPAFDDVIVLQAPGLLKSWQTMSQILAGMADAEGNLVPFPAVFESVTAPWYDQNVYHHFGISPQVNAKGKQMMEKYEAFIASLKDSRPDLMEAINDWYTCADKPLEGASRDRLTQAYGMTNPRKGRR